MALPRSAQATPTPRALLAGSLVLMVAFGTLVSALPLRLVQPAISLGLGTVNLAAFPLLLRRALERGPEQKGWRLLTLSFLGVVASNAALLVSPAQLNTVSVAEGIFVGLQPFIALLQGAALLSWPFREPARTSHRIMSLLGCLIFGGSLFLVLWSTALYRELDHGQWPVYFRMMGLAVRVALVGGAATYILADDPRRIRGPVGWIFAAAVGVVAIILLVRPFLYDQHAVMQASPFFGLVLSGPLAFASAAWVRTPAEVPIDEPRLRYPMVEGLIYLPFMAVGILLMLSALHRQDHLLAPLSGFMAVSALLLIRQFLLLREVRRSNERLEERVLQRTRSLEELQHVVLRTERLNSIGVLGAGLTHDLNNALASIRATAEITRLKMETGEPADTTDLDRIIVAADQSATLTGRLMAFARQEDEIHQDLDLAAEVSSLEAILRMLLNRQTTLSLNLGYEAVPIRGSRTQIEQILVNLVGNARDAMPTGGAIRVDVAADRGSDPPMARLRVKDEGQGMSPETLSRLFQPFFTTKAPGKGTGLGLASVRLLVEEAQGTIQVESEPGRGTCFTLSFPLKR